MKSSFHKLVLLLPIASTVHSITSETYQLDSHFAGPTFLDNFAFFTGHDPTNGFVHYVNASYASTSGLIKQLADGSTYIGVDYQSVLVPYGTGRDSVRISSTKSWGVGSLVVVDLAHVPGGQCGTWPAMWMVGPNWPNSGEVDIIEGVNGNTENLMSLHTSSNCTVSKGSAQLGTQQTTICDASINQNSGCGVTSNDPRSYGTGFNTAAGGVYALQINPLSIAIWFFPRSLIPADLSNPSSFGTPQANFTGCDIASRYQNLSLVFDNTFCGDWAGAVFQFDATCAPLDANGCVDFVAKNPAAFEGAWWGVNWVDVYTLAGVTATSVSVSPSSSSSRGTSSSSQSVLFTTSSGSQSVPTSTSSSSSSLSSSSASLVISTSSPTSSSQPTTSSTSLLSSTSSRQIATSSSSSSFARSTSRSQSSARSSISSSSSASLSQGSVLSASRSSASTKSGSSSTSVSKGTSISHSTSLPTVSSSKQSSSSTKRSSSSTAKFTSTTSLKISSSSTKKSSSTTRVTNTSSVKSSISSYTKKSSSSTAQSTSMTSFKQSSSSVTISSLVSNKHSHHRSFKTTSTSSKFSSSSTHTSSTSSKPSALGRRSTYMDIVSSSKDTGTSSRSQFPGNKLASRSSEILFSPSKTKSTSSTLSALARRSTYVEISPSIKYTGTGPHPSSTSTKKPSSSPEISTNKHTISTSSRISTSTSQLTTPSSPSNILTFQYLGCINSLSFPSPSTNTSSPNMTLTICVQSCQLFALASIYDTTCFCSNSFPTILPIPKSGICDLPCPGDGSQVCGGGGSFSRVKEREVEGEDGVGLSVYRNMIPFTGVGAGGTGHGNENENSAALTYQGAGRRVEMRLGIGCLTWLGIVLWGV